MNKKSQLSDESDLDQFASDQLPPLHNKTKVQSIGKKIKKPANMVYLNPNNEKGDGSSAMLVSNKQSMGIHIPISKKVVPDNQIYEHKKNYVSPYSQKAIKGMGSHPE